MNDQQLQDAEGRAVLWNYAFMGLREMAVGGMLFALVPLLAWGLLERIWPVTRVILSIVMAICVGASMVRWLRKGSPISLLTFRSYYEKRTGYMEPKLCPRSSWPNRKLMLAGAIAGAAAAPALLVLSWSVREVDLPPILGPTILTALLGASFVTEGLWGNRPAYTLGGLVVLVGTAASWTVRWPPDLCWTYPILALAVGFVSVGVADHRLYLRLWHEGRRIGGPVSDGQ